ncbi:hypothetical protein E2C01_075923 [Portunus trituberculatus]|uniref:Uncharacterized protein n=1 Tax=Portunus trituberculatus TaxID=210409 RepID=A0A5B7IH12_PORTR|nr:hypothetical protein [Portunus trituberculatus]
MQQSRETVIEKVKQHFADDVIILSSPGYASIMAFRNSASFVLKMVKDDKAHDDLKHSKIQIARSIEQECKDMKCNRTHYNLHIDKDKMDETVSPTLSSLISLISPKMKRTSLAAAMVGNIVTSQVTNQPTDLQIALGLLTRDSKKVVDQLYDFRVTCSYDEVMRFKKSAAHASYSDACLQRLSDASSRLLQTTLMLTFHRPGNKPTRT